MPHCQINDAPREGSEELDWVVKKLASVANMAMEVLPTPNLNRPSLALPESCKTIHDL